MILLSVINQIFNILQQFNIGLICPEILFVIIIFRMNVAYRYS